MWSHAITTTGSFAHTQILRYRYDTTVFIVVRSHIELEFGNHNITSVTLRNSMTHYKHSVEFLTPPISKCCIYFWKPQTLQHVTRTEQCHGCVINITTRDVNFDIFSVDLVHASPAIVSACCAFSPSRVLQRNHSLRTLSCGFAPRGLRPVMLGPDRAVTCFCVGSHLVIQTLLAVIWWMSRGRRHLPDLRRVSSILAILVCRSSLLILGEES